MWANKLKFNSSEMKVPQVNKSDLRFKVSAVLEGVVLPFNEWVHKLEVLLDKGLLQDKQVPAVASSAFYCFG